jgi:hypothetical protein
MTVADSMTPLSVVNHINGAVSAAASPGTAAAVGVFRSAVVTSYGPDGTSPAAVGNLDFSKVQFAKDGSISGGQILHSSATPDGKPISSTTLQLAAGGKPSQAQSQIHNKRDAGVAKVLNTDFSSLKWTDGGKISSGEMRFSTNHPVTGAQRSSASMVFQNEKLASGAVTDYSATDAKAVEAITELDYTGMNFQGMKVMGGQMKVTRKKPDQTVSSKSQVAFVPNGLGRVQQIQTANMDAASGAVKSNVTSDFSGVSFNARNDIDSGDVNLQVTAPDQTPLAHTVLSFANAVPKTAQTFQFQGGVLASKIVTDYSGATFDNDNHVANGSLKLDIYDGAEQHVLSSQVAYDPTAPAPTKQTQRFAVAAPSNAKAFQEVAARWQNAAPKPTQSTPPATVAKQPTPPGATPVTKKTLRSDGTLEETVTTISQNGIPVSAEITHYDTDGKTVMTSFKADLSKVVVAASQAKPSGSVKLQEYTGGATLHAESVFNYA